MRTYLTGASGFLGTNLSSKLTGDVTAIPHDKITSTEYLPFDYFFFLSTYGNLASHTQGLKVFQANVIEPLYVIERAVKFDFKSFVYISTSSVKLKTQTSYSRAKKSAEEIMLAFLERYNKPICIVRPLSITGVGEQKEHLIPTLIDAAFTGKTENLVTWPTHDYIDIDDVTDGILSLAQNGARGVFELGSGVSYTNLEVKQLVEEITGKEIHVNPVDSMRGYDSAEWKSTNFKSRGFGWLPKKPLKQSIEEMVKQYETN